MVDVGGEAFIFKHDSKAIKIYKSPNQQKIDKLLYILSFKKHIPNEFCYPEKLVYDEKDKVVGFSMRLIPKSYQVFEELTKRRFQETQGYNLKTVTELFLHLYDLVSKIHPENICIGDFNDRNLLFKDNNISFIDTDSHQIDKFPCPVATETYLDPNLYDKVLADKTYFSNLTDWYSWFVMYIKCTLFIHPYGGMNVKYQRLLDRAKNKITFMDKDVIVPKFAIKPEILSTELLDMFEKIFKKGSRFVPDKNIFVELNESSVVCKSCKIAYWGQRKSCPNCSVKNIEVISKKPTVVLNNIKYTKIFETHENIFSHRLFGSELYFSISNNGSGTIKKLNLNNNSIHTILNHNKVIDEFDISNDTFAFTTYLSENIYIRSNQVSQEIIVGNYKNKPVFGLSDSKAFFTYGGQINFLDLSNMVRQHFDQCCENQTWFETHKNYIFGFQRIFGLHDFFLYRINKLSRWSLKFIEIDDRESILETKSYINGDKLLLLVKTEKNRKINTKVYCVDVHDPTKLLFSFESSSLMSEVYKTLEGKTFFCGRELIVLHSSDDGIMQHVFDGKAHKFVSFSGSENFVSKGDSIIPFGKGMLVISEKEIGQLDMS